MTEYCAHGEQVFHQKDIDAAREMGFTDRKRLVEALDLEAATIEKDERFHYKPAIVEINAPLALIQTAMEAKIGLIRKLRALLAETKEEK